MSFRAVAFMPPKHYLSTRGPLSLLAQYLASKRTKTLSNICFALLKRTPQESHFSLRSEYFMLCRSPTVECTIGQELLR